MRRHFVTVQDAQTWVDNSGVVEWDWGTIASADALARLTQWIYRHGVNVAEGFGAIDDATLRAFIARDLQDDPDQYT